MAAKMMGSSVLGVQSEMSRLKSWQASCKLHAIYIAAYIAPFESSTDLFSNLEKRARRVSPANRFIAGQPPRHP